MKYTFFSQNIKKLRERDGFTQESLAARINEITNSKCDHSTISNWERGTRLPEHEYAFALSDIFNVSTRELLTVEITIIDLPFKVNYVSFVADIDLLQTKKYRNELMRFVNYCKKDVKEDLTDLRKELLRMDNRIQRENKTIYEL